MSTSFSHETKVHRYYPEYEVLSLDSNNSMKILEDDNIPHTYETYFATTYQKAEGVITFRIFDERVDRIDGGSYRDPEKFTKSVVQKNNADIKFVIASLEDCIKYLIKFFETSEEDIKEKLKTCRLAIIGRAIDRYFKPLNEFFDNYKNSL